MDNKQISELLINDYNLDSLETVIPYGESFSMFVTPRFVHAYSQGYEKFSTRILKNFVKKCDQFVDVGAHYGYYTLLAASANKDINIIAIEPITENFKILNKNIIHNYNDTKRVKCINAAASSNSGKINFYKSEASDNSSVLLHPNAATLEQLEVSSESLDDLLKNEQYKSLLVKIDTEGSEMVVLKGLSATLKKCDDITILLEMNPKLFKLAGTSCKELVEYLAAKGFNVYGIDDRESKYYPLDAADNLYKLESENSFFNALCIKKEKSLSVAFFSHNAFLSGAERSLADLIEDLCNDSVLCSVLLPSDGPLKDVLLDKGAAVFILPGYAHWWAVDKRFFNEEKQKLQFAQSMMATVIGALPILKQIRPDIIYTQTIVVPWGALCAEILSIPHVLSVCEYGELDYNLKFDFGFQKSIKALYDSSKAIFSITKSVKNEVFKSIIDKDNKTEVVYRNVRLTGNNDLDITPQDYDYKHKSEIKIAIFGTINAGKGQEDIVRAGIALMKRGLKIKVYFFGYSDPHYLAFIKDLIRCSVYKENFIIKDFVNDPIEQMKDMDIVVSCSRNEALGRTLFEAILIDKPIVYSDSGGPKEIFTDEEHGLAYKCADDLSLAEKLLFVIDHPDQTKQRVKTAKEYVLKNFNQGNYSGKIETRLKQIKGTKSGTSHSMQSLLSIDFLIDAMQVEFDRKDAEFAAVSNELANRSEQISLLETQCDERGLMIQELRNSSSWKITAPLRFISTKLNWLLQKPGGKSQKDIN